MKPLKAALLLVALYENFLAAAGTCLPLTTDSNLCSNPPGTTSSDGLDDVCVLVACCNGGDTAAVEIPSGSSIACPNVNCTSVCDLSNMRSGLGIEACDSTCTPPAQPSGSGDLTCTFVCWEGSEQDPGAQISCRVTTRFPGAGPCACYEEPG